MSDNVTAPPEGGDAPPELDDTGVEAYAGRQRACGEDGCSLQRTDAEIAWEELMSAVPDEGVTFQVPAERNKYYHPTESTFAAVLDAIRPSDEYAIKPIAYYWKEVSETQLEAVRADLESAIKTLSNSWEGDDFDDLSDTVDETLTMIVNTQEKVDNLKTELEDVAEAIRTRQALEAGETPFPPAELFLKKDEECCDSYKLHIRPPWHTGNCEILEGADEIAEGLTTEGAAVVAEMREWIDNRTTELVENDGLSEEEARQQARQEAQDEVDSDSEDELQEYMEASEAEIADIMARRDGSADDVGNMDFGSQPETPPAVADEDQVEPSPGPGAPPAGSTPETGGLGDFNSGATPSAPSTPDIGGPNGPGGSNGLPDTGSPPDTGDIGDDGSPWDPSSPDPDDLGGGLAGGGGGGAGGGLGGPPGTGGGLGGGAGAGAGAGAGGMGGGMMGGMGGGRGGGAGGGKGAGGGRGGGMGRGGGAGGGRGAGGRGMGGGMMGGGGGRGMGGGSGDEDGQATWLTEEDDVWGIGNEDEDPYA